jgi:hypothetical protein
MQECSRRPHFTPGRWRTTSHALLGPITSLPHGEVRTKPTSRPNPARFLYASAAALLFVLMFLGFQQFYLHGKGYPDHPLFPTIKGVIVAHGVSMTGWMVLFLVQPLLIVSNNRRMHMSLGILGAMLAGLVVILGLWTAIATARVEPDVVLWGLHRKQFMAIPIFAILTFGAFVTIGVRNRRRPEIHRPMMLLATLMVMPAAVDRITGVPDLWTLTAWGRLFGPFFAPIVIGAAFLALKTALTRSFDRWFAGGFVVLSLIGAFIMLIAPTASWENLASFMARWEGQ